MSEKLSYSDLTKLTGFTYRTIKKRLYKADVKPMERRGGAILFDSAVALKFLYSFQPVKDGEDYSALLEMERHRKLKRENDIEEQKVAPVALLQEALEKSAAVFVPILESIPNEIRRYRPDVTSDELFLVQKAIANCRNAIADSRIEMDD